MFLLWLDDRGTVTERALRAAGAYLAKHGRWPATIHAHPADLPSPQTLQVDGQPIRLLPAPYVLRSHLHVGV
jgi:hypothetical protein